MNRYIIAITCSIILLAGCQKNELSLNVKESCNLEVTATIFNQSKVDASDSNDNITVTWKEGDEIYGYYYEEGSDIYSNVVRYKIEENGISGEKAYFKLQDGVVDGIKDGTKFFMVYNPSKNNQIIPTNGQFPVEFSSQQGTLADAMNHLYMTGEGTVNHDTGTNKFTIDLTFESQMAILKIAGLKCGQTDLQSGQNLLIRATGGMPTSGTISNSDKKFTVNDGGNGISVKVQSGDTYCAIPTGITISNLTMTSLGSDGLKYKWSSNSTNKLVSTRCYTFGGSLNGEVISKPFKVSADKSVYFSPGNLQFQASQDGSTKNFVWRFAEHSWDFVGGYVTSNPSSIFGNVYENGVKCNNNDVSATYKGWVDLFSFATSGYNDKYPYLTYNEIKYFYGEEDITGTEYDWGYHNAIGGSSEHTWRVLSYDEWKYLISEREGITINGVNGIRYACVAIGDATEYKATDPLLKSEQSILIIFPDSFEWPNNVDYNHITENCCNYITQYTTNYTPPFTYGRYCVFSKEDIIKLEEAGVAILPTTGCKLSDGNGYLDFNNFKYWTGSLNYKDNSVKVYSSGNQEFLSMGGFYIAALSDKCAVRLVKDANN